MSQFNFEAIGTRWQLEIYEPILGISEEKLLEKIMSRIEDFDISYSRFRADSLVTKMSKEIGEFSLPSDAEKIFSLYYDLYKKTNGLFTPLVGDLLSDAGYDATYTLKQKNELKIPPKWEDVFTYRDSKINMKVPAMLDLGAGGKGYLIDIVGEILMQNEIKEFCIDAGGDILQKSKNTIRVGLENPENTSQVVGVYTLGSGSICGSAGNRRAWGEFTHIINPKTLSSHGDIVAVWVIADTALLADCLATCLFFVPAEILSLYNFEYVLIRKDHSFEKSANFKGELFIARQDLAEQ